MVTPALVDLLVTLYEDLYGRVGGQIVRLLLMKGRCSAIEIAKATGLSPSAVQRTLVSLIVNRFVLFYERQNRTMYFANPRELYALLWTGQLLAQLLPTHQPAMLQVIVNGLVPGTLPEYEPLIASKSLQLASIHEFWPEEELRETLEQEKLREVQSNPETMGKSEAAKRTQVIADAQRELARIKEVQDVGNGPTLYRINWEKFIIEGRTHELAAFAARSIGEITAEVYKAVLKLSEPGISHPRLPRIATLETTVTTNDVVNELFKVWGNETSAKLSSVFMAYINSTATDNNEIKEESSAKRVKLNSGNAAKLKGDPMNMKPAELVNKHLDLLVESRAARFIQRVGSRNGGEWFVPFEKVVPDLQQASFDEILAASLGEPAARLIQLIRKTGKLDEKMLGHQALLPALEIRHQMSALGSYGFADIQELSKPNDRNTSAAAQKRSLFLWHHRPKWAYSRLVDLLYTQMLDTVKETHDLRSKHAILLAKLAREDVQSNIAEFLTEREHEELAEYEKKERDMYKRINMIDRNVRIFREY